MLEEFFGTKENMRIYKQCLFESEKVLFKDRTKFYAVKNAELIHKIKINELMWMIKLKIAWSRYTLAMLIICNGLNIGFLPSSFFLRVSLIGNLLFIS